MIEATLILAHTKQFHGLHTFRTLCLPAGSVELGLEYLDIPDIRLVDFHQLTAFGLHYSCIICTRCRE